MEPTDQVPSGYIVFLANKLKKQFGLDLKRSEILNRIAKVCGNSHIRTYKQIKDKANAFDITMEGIIFDRKDAIAAEFGISESELTELLHFRPASQAVGWEFLVLWRILHPRVSPGKVVKQFLDQDKEYWLSQDLASADHATEPDHDDEIPLAAISVEQIIEYYRTYLESCDYFSKKNAYDKISLLKEAIGRHGLEAVRNMTRYSLRKFTEYAHGPARMNATALNKELEEISRAIANGERSDRPPLQSDAQFIMAAVTSLSHEVFALTDRQKQQGDYWSKQAKLLFVPVALHVISEHDESEEGSMLFLMDDFLSQFSSDADWDPESCFTEISRSHLHPEELHEMIITQLEPFHTRKAVELKGIFSTLSAAIKTALKGYRWATRYRPLAQKEAQKQIRATKERREQALSNIQNDVDRIVTDHGHMVLHVMADYDQMRPPFTYTIGLSKTYGHPEIIVFGLSRETSHTLLNQIATRIRIEGFRVEEKKRYTDMTKDALPMMFRTVTDREYSVQASEYYHGDHEYQLVQLIWADPNGNLPGEDDFDTSFNTFQPLLA
jgi:hypothetical protein